MRKHRGITTTYFHNMDSLGRSMSILKKWIHFIFLFDVETKNASWTPIQYWSHHSRSLTSLLFQTKNPVFIVPEMTKLDFQKKGHI